MEHLQLIKRRIIRESKAKVPAYIVTFSDMVTLLLTFFVMLLSLANVQDPELFNKGRDSFLRSIRSLGLGVLYSKEQVSDFGQTKIKHFINTPDGLSRGRTIDAREEGIRRIFQKVSQSRFIRTMSSQIVAEKTSFSVTSIRFARADAALSESAKRFLTKFCSDLQQSLDAEGIGLYVLGLAGDEPTQKQQWILSARRAQAVADFLQNVLPLIPVYSWGAGPGGDWVAQDSPVSRQSQILIAVLRKNG